METEGNLGSKLNLSLSMRVGNYNPFFNEFKEVKSLSGFIPGNYQVLIILFLKVTQMRPGDGPESSRQCQTMEVRCDEVLAETRSVGEGPSHSLRSGARHSQRIRRKGVMEKELFPNELGLSISNLQQFSVFSHFQCKIYRNVSLFLRFWLSKVRVTHMPSG